MKPERQVALFGAALDTGNLGVEALATSFLDGITTRDPQARVTVFDNGWGRRDQVIETAAGPLDYEARGVRLSRRLHRPESLYTMQAVTRLGLRLASRLNDNVASLARCDAIADVSGGDSFTDMYGPRRFSAMVLPKDLALRVGRPLVLLPQTYGPFRSSEARAEAIRLVRGASHCWSRDTQGFGQLGELLGDAFDPTRHFSGVDMAFGLRPHRPAALAGDHAAIDEWLASDEPTAGINVSGLLARPAPAGVTTDSMSIDYPTTMTALVERVLADGARVLLVPHVLGSNPGSESDELALAAMVRDNPQWDSDRVRVLPTPTGAGEAKWWISRCDWFCGTRMHSTIAALSTGVPTAAIAYSLKTEPVFATVGQQQHVIDGRSSTGDEVLERLTASWQDRAATAVALANDLPQLLERVQVQMHDIARALGCPT